MAVEVLSVVCAWCKSVVTAAPNGTAVSHTICPPCLDRMIAQSGDCPVDPAVFQVSPDYFGDAFKQ